MGNRWHRIEIRLLTLDIDALYRDTGGVVVGGWSTVTSGTGTSHLYGDLFSMIEEMFQITLQHGSFNLTLKEPIKKLPPTPLDLNAGHLRWHLAPATVAIRDKRAGAIVFRDGSTPLVGQRIYRRSKTR